MNIEGGCWKPAVDCSTGGSTGATSTGAVAIGGFGPGCGDPAEMCGTGS